MTDIFAVRDAAIVSFKSIKRAAGYQSNVVDAHVHGTFKSAVVDDTGEASYPKYFIMPDSSAHQNGVGGHARDEGILVVMLIIKQLSEEDDVQASMETLIRDVVRWSRTDPTLGNLVNEFSLDKMVTDGGVSEPEAIAILRFTARWSGFQN